MGQLIKVDLDGFKIQEDLRKPKPVTLDEEEYRKPITQHTGNPTCDSGLRRVQETYH